MTVKVKRRTVADRQPHRVRYIMEGFSPRLKPGLYPAQLIVTPSSYGVIDFIVRPL